VEEGLGLARARSNGSRGSRARAGVSARKKEALTSGPGRSAGEGGADVPLRDGAMLGRCQKLAWAGSVPATSFTFFCSLLFLFLISYFFYNFCNKASNDFKPTSKIF
jgi:hypothetical protein